MRTEIFAWLMAMLFITGCGGAAYRYRAALSCKRPIKPAVRSKAS